MRTITTAPGIGDFLWIAQKLINQPEKFDWIIPVGDSTNKVETRAFQLEKLLPTLINTMRYEHLRFRRDVARNSHSGDWASARQNSFCLEANSHLEAGRNIKGFLPDLKTSYLIDFNTSEENKMEAANVLAPFEGQKLCGIYTSNQAKKYYRNPKNSSWLAGEWIQLIDLIKSFDDDYRFVFIGADYDRPLTQEVALGCEKFGIAKCINRELGTAIEVLKKLDIFISFQSGMSIINELIGAKQTVMLHWDDERHENLMNAWPDPKRIWETKQYKGCAFDHPQVIFDWLVENEKL